MMLPITLLVLAAVGQAAESKLPPASKTTDETKTNKRELFEGNYGLRNGLSFGTKFGAPPGIEYADEKDNLADKSFFGGRGPQISKISDVLTGQGPPFEVAVADHLYSPVSVYQARLSSPTTFDVPSEASQLGYPEHKLYKQSQEYSQQFGQNPQNSEPKPGYRPEYSREESKLLHLETAFPRLEPSYSTPAPLTQDFFIQQLPDIDSQLYPHYSYQHVEQIPLRYPGGTIQPLQYVQQSLVQLVPVKSESDNGQTSRDQDNQQNESPKAVQISTEATNEDNNAQPEQVPTYASLYQTQPYAPSQQYLPVPLPNDQHPQDQYQQVSVQQSTSPPEEEVVQIQQRGNHYQQYQKNLQTQEQSPEAESPQQVLEIQQTTPQPEVEYQSIANIQGALPTQPEPAQPQTTFKPFLEYSTAPNLLESEEPSTTVTPFTTHKPLSRMPLAPLRPLPGFRRLPQPRPFSNTLPTTAAPTRFTTFSPLPPFRRFPNLNTRQPTFPTLSTTLSSQPAITTTPQPYPTEIISTQPPPSTVAVSRKPIIRIRHKPLFNQFQSTTQLPPRSDVTLEPLSQPTSTFQPSTTLEQETQAGLQRVQTPRPDATQGPEYLPPSELPPQSQPGVIYHLQSQTHTPSSPRPELLYPQPLLQPQLQLYPQPSPPPQAYSQQLLIQPPRAHLQSFLQPGQLQLYQLPVFNLRPQYQPLSTPLPLLLPTEQTQPKVTQPELQSRPDAQEPKKLKPLGIESKVLSAGESYLTAGSIVRPEQPILHPQLYSQTREVYIHPDFHRPAAPTYPKVQYFGKYAEAIFGHYQHK